MELIKYSAQVNHVVDHAHVTTPSVFTQDCYTTIQKIALHILDRLIKVVQLDVC